MVIHFEFNYFWHYYQMKLICNLMLLVSFICKGLDKTNLKLSANTTQLRPIKSYLKYLSLGNLEAISLLYHTLNLKSLVESSFLKLFYTFIVAFITYVSKLLIALYVYQLFSYECWAKHIFCRLIEVSDFILRAFIWKFLEL